MPHVFQSHREFKEWFSNPLTGMIEGSQEYNENLVKRLHKVSQRRGHTLKLHREGSYNRVGTVGFTPSVLLLTGPAALSPTKGESGCRKANAKEIRTRHQVPALQAPALSL